MKVASKLIFLINDPEGFSAAIFDALQPTPDSLLQRSEEKIELSLEQYGIKDQKACGSIANFTDNKGLLQVSLLLLEYYEPPILSCIVNEVLRSIRGESLSSTVSLILPYILPATKLKCEDKDSSVNNNRSSLYGLHLGPVTEFTEDMLREAEKPPLSLQINYEPLTCLLQLVQFFNCPTAVLIGKRGMKGEHEVLHEVGEILASAFSLCFIKNRIKLSIGETVKPKEPWRALYG
ncbi:hypothetical protein SOVF_007760 [Spinacia oleracea]|uniref:DUF7894 domain-containing protein n=1 Tax=Spinacia oleracea TaxID=3562 RepID=A0A9R0J7V7_SPIOL|nr:uncharacterized protein LOC110801967 [Spinacia oleracea]KNA25312.1 hypothetical protein SOVF_007760 [Spinacia oleracea]